MTSPSPIWYFGPDWDMRALVCPEPNIDITVERYGGVFQGLSGARTMDVTGHRQRYSFRFEFLTPEEYTWLQSLHYRSIQGPFRLLSPLGKNLLSAKGSLLKPTTGFATAGQGLAPGGGTLTRVLDWPSAAPALGDSAARWIPVSNYARVDPRDMFPVTPGEPITLSVYAKGEVAGDAWVIADWYDKTRTELGPSTNTGALTVSTSWNRLTLTATPPAGAYTARMALWSDDTTAIRFAAAQAEYGSAATTWELGGSAPRVLFSSLETDSPRFPYVNTTLTILEA